MGFLDKLKNIGAADIALTLEVDKTEAAPGDEINVRFDIAGELDDKCRNVRVAFAGTGSYKVKETTRNHEGEYRTNEVWRSVELHKEEHHYPVQAGPGEARFTIPADAQPSSIAVVDWTVSVVVDRERGRDAIEKQEVQVRRSAADQPTARAPRTAADGLTLDDVPVAARRGDELTGHLTVNVAKDVSVTAARIRLHVRTTYTASSIGYSGMNPGSLVEIFDWSGKSDHITDDSQVAEIDLSGKREFKAGSAEQVPFSITVPAAAGPTTEHVHARVEWRVEALLDRRMRDDLSVEIPLIVF